MPDNGLFFGTGEVSDLMRKTDWSRTAIGLPGTWPRSLCTVVNLCLASRYPITIFWGPSFVQFYNDAYRPVLGTKHPAALGQRGHLVWPEIWPTVLGPMFADVLRGVSHAGDDALFLLDRHGYVEETYFNFSYDPIRDDDGRIGGVFVACQETTERVLAERRLQTVRALAQIGNEAKTVDAACALVGRALEANPKDVPFALLYLRDGGGVLRPRSATRTAAPEDVPAFVVPVASGESPFGSSPVGDIEKGLALAEEAPPPTEAMAVPITAVGEAAPIGALVVGRNPRRALDDRYRAFLDMAAASISSALTTARAYQEAQERARALAELDRAKTDFFSNVSHEFRTPLTLLLGPAEEALRGETLTPEDRKRFELVHRNALRLAKLVNTLLDFSRIEAGRVEACFRATALSSLTHELASVFRSAVERAGLRLEVDTPPMREPVYVDHDMWEKIVLNLLSNALKHTFDGEIAVRIREGDASVELEVRDTGVGIPEDELPRIFERFHRVKNVRARTHEGTGIGLALVQELVKLHGGSIHAASAIDRGTSVRVTVPKGTAHLPPDRIQADKKQESIAAGAGPFVQEALRWLPSSESDASTESSPGEDASCVLVADDNTDMRDYLTRLMRERWRVEAVSDGRRALEAARSHRPDVVVADVMMPGLDGFALVRALREDPATASTPVILLSARAGDEATAEGLRKGADDYLAKPFSARQLLARVEVQLASARARREARAAAERERARLYSLFMQAPAAIVILRGPDLVIELANPVWLGVVRKDEGVVGRRLLDVLPELRVQSVREMLARVLRTGIAEHGDSFPVHLDRRGDGRLDEAYFDFVYAPMREVDDTISGVLVFGFEVTDRVAARKRIEQLRAAAESANRAKDEFFSALSHELRTPLNAIIGWSQMLCRNAVAAEQVPRALEAIERSARMQSRLIEDMLDLARIEQGKLVLSVGPVETTRVVEAAIDAVRPAADAKGVRIQPVLDSHATIVGDADRLQQVVWNLLSNAIKFTLRGGRVQVRLRREHSYVEIAVADDGQGIDPGFLPHVFDRFRQAEVAGAPKSGLGLGLAIVRSIVELHGGNVTAQSDGIGKGATFVVRLPTAPLRAEAAAALDDDLVHEPPRTFECPPELRGLRLLVIDDEGETRELLRYVLEQCETHVTLAASAQAGLDEIGRGEFDVLVSDIGMPEHDGYWLIRQVRKLPVSRGGRTPAVALTAYARTEDRTAALRAGFDMHLIKPIDPNELLVVIATLVRMRQAFLSNAPSSNGA